MKKVLIVDDDVDILEPLSLLLEMKGYKVDSISKGEETYKKIKKFKPHLILLDILMSGSDGRVICANLKKQKSTRNIPIVLMSAHPNLKFDSLKSGANGFIAKPFEIDELCGIIDSNLS